MQRYFLDLENGDGTVRDVQGKVFPSREAARLAAARMAPQITHDEVELSDRFRVLVCGRDEAGRHIFPARLDFEVAWLIS